MTAFPHWVTKDSSQLLRFDALSLRGEPTGAIVRRATIDGFDITLVEISADRCPQINEIARAFAQLPPPRTRPADVVEGPHPIYLEGPGNENITGGPTYSVKTSARFENLSASRLEYTAGNISPVANWFDQSLAALGPCWQDAES